MDSEMEDFCRDPGTLATIVESTCSRDQCRSLLVVEKVPLSLLPHAARRRDSAVPVFVVTDDVVVEDVNGASRRDARAASGAAEPAGGDVVRVSHVALSRVPSKRLECCDRPVWL